MEQEALHRSFAHDAFGEECMEFVMINKCGGKRANRGIVPLLWSLSRKDSSLSSLLSPSTLTSVLLEISVQQKQTEV